MPDTGRPFEQVLHSLKERAKELNCIYRVEEILHADETPLEDLLRLVADALPPGWQYPAHCVPRIRHRDLDVHPPAFVETPWAQSAPIELQGQNVGSVSVYYTQQFPAADEGPFLKDERRLIDTIAARIAQTLLHRELAQVFAAARDAAPTTRENWRAVVDLLRHTDLRLYHRIGRKMLNRLSRGGIEEAKALLARLAEARGNGGTELEDENRPLQRQAQQDMDAVAAETFEIAAEHLSERDLLGSLEAWLQEERVHFLVLALETSGTSLAEIAAAHHERLDGSGYPNGIKGDDQSLQARIIALGDVFDA